MKFFQTSLFLILCANYCLGTEVKQCPGIEKTIDELNKRVSIGNCNKPPCRLRKNTSLAFELKFKPNYDVKDLKQTVNANILGIPFPFVGVDGTSACENIYEATGNTKVGCNLKAGTEYIFKTKIDVLQIYPRVKTVVHWALTDPSGKDVICFEVPARITN